MATNTRDIDPKLVKKVVKLRDDDTSWSDIAEEIGTTPGRARFIFMVSEEEEVGATPARVKKWRQSGDSWGRISARTGVSEAAAKALYEEATGEDASDSRVGGGRWPDGKAPKGEKKAPAKPKGEKKAPAKKAAAKGKRQAIADDISLDDLKAKVEGKVVTWKRHSDGQSDSARIASVTKLAKNRAGDRGFKAVDNNKSNRSILFNQIVSIKK